MSHFNIFYEKAIERKGGQSIVESNLPMPLSGHELETIDDNNYLAMMTKRIFQSGFVWRVIENKWQGFEDVFYKFNIETLTHLPDETFEAMVKDKRIVRNWQKIKTVRHNAHMINNLAKEHGSFAKFIAQWPEDDIINLWAYLKKNGMRLGGNTGPYVLRSMGKDTFLATNDVRKALMQEGVFDTLPTDCKRDLNIMQTTFNRLHQESGRSYSEISQILAYSVL